MNFNFDNENAEYQNSHWPILSKNDQILIVNPHNTWWSYSLSLELVFKYQNICKKIYWINLSSNNKRKFHMNENDYINNYFVKNPVKIINKLNYNKNIILLSKPTKILNLSKSQTILKNKISDKEEISHWEHTIKRLVEIEIINKFQKLDFEPGEIDEYNKHYTKQAYSQLIRLIDINTKYNLNLNYVFAINDRFLSSALSLLYFKKLGVKTRVFYFGSNFKKIQAYKESLFSYKDWREQFSEFSKHLNLTISQKKIIEKKAHKKFLQRSDDAIEFEQKMVKGKGLTKISNNPFCVFYATSEWENSGFYNNYKVNDFNNQRVAFDEIANFLISKGYKIILKKHPNRINENKKSDKIWEGLDNDPMIEVLDENSPIDVHELIQQSFINIFWKSSLGIESLLLGKLTVIMGRPIWLDEKWNIHIWNKMDLVKLSNLKLLDNSSIDLSSWYLFYTSFGIEINNVYFNDFIPIVNGIRIIEKRMYYKLLSILIDILKRFCKI